MDSNDIASQEFMLQQRCVGFLQVGDAPNTVKRSRSIQNLAENEMNFF